MPPYDAHKNLELSLIFSIHGEGLGVGQDKGFTLVFILICFTLLYLLIAS